MPRFKSLFGVLVVAAAFYLLWKIMPPYVQAYQFQEELQTIARNNEYSLLDENGIRDQVKAKIVEIGVPVNPEVVVIQKGGGDCTIGVNYTVNVDAMDHAFDIKLHPETKKSTKQDHTSKKTQ